MTDAEIKAEIQADPEGLGYADHAAAGDHAGLAGLINRKAYRGPVPIKELSSYCTRMGITGTIEAVAYEPTSDQITLPLKGLCRNVLTLIRDDYRLETIDVDDPGFGPGCDALVGSGLMAGSDKAAILALADDRASRAEVLWGPGVVLNHPDITRALRS